MIQGINDDGFSNRLGGGRGQTTPYFMRRVL